MKAKVTITIQLKSVGAADIAEHALRQHGEAKLLKGNKVEFSRSWNLTSSFVNAIAGTKDSVHVILVHEAGFELNAYRTVAVAAEEL